MAHLALSFLGGFQVLLDDRPVTEFKSNKVRALLAFLAVEAARPQRREMLAGLLWPNRTNRDALSNLRYSLANLRGTLGDRSGGASFLLISPDAIQFNQESDHWLDVAALEKAVVAARVPGQTDIDDLSCAVALYQGGFLDGFSVADAVPFEEWTLLRREQLARQVTWALASLAAVFEARGDYAQAQAMARRHVTLEPWNENAHRSLMRVLARDEQRSAALHQFQVCRRILEEELGVEPAKETIALVEAIRKQGWTYREIRTPRTATGVIAPPVGARASQRQTDSALTAALDSVSRRLACGTRGNGWTSQPQPNQEDARIPGPHCLSRTAKSQERNQKPMTRDISAFDIIGPIMVGPSSSHTAGAVRLGQVARAVLGSQPVDALIELHGSFAHTGRGHGTDRGIVAGLLDMPADDPDLRHSFELAEKAGMAFRFEAVDLGDEAHPNSARLTVSDGQRRVQVTGSSVGGGMVRIDEVDGYRVQFGCEYDTLLVVAEDRPGTVNQVTGWMLRQGINIAFLRIERDRRGGTAIMVIETDQPVDPVLLEAFEDYDWVRWARYVPRIDA